jgi:hypothetical protein
LEVRSEQGEGLDSAIAIPHVMLWFARFLTLAWIASQADLSRRGR